MNGDVRFQIAKQDISTAVLGSTVRILDSAALEALLNQHRDFWRLDSMTTRQFVRLLVQHQVVQEVRLDFPNRPIYRYLSSPASVFELAQSLNLQGYFSHFSAMSVNQLTDQIPKTIYFNVEQTARGGGGTLTQGAIDRVLKGKCRVSGNIAQYKNRSICQISGGNTDQLGVVATQSPDSNTQIRVTNLERTLIDIAIRPIYSGGVQQVADAFRLAKPTVSVNRLAAYLKTLNYTYPFHQVIGYYLERAEYSASQVQLLAAFPQQFDFYLDYGLKQTRYVPRWRLHVPQGF